MSASFPGDSPTPAGRPKKPLPLSAAGIGARAKHKAVGTTVQLPEKARKLKEELELQRTLVVRARAHLETELANLVGALPRDYTVRLKDLTSCLGDLTQATIRLEQNEKKLGGDLTPAEERDTAIQFILAMDPPDRAEVVAFLIEKTQWK